MKKALPVIFSLIILSFSSNAQVRPLLEWQKPLGGTLIDEAYCAKQSRDGGFIVVGKSNSANADLTGLGNHGNYDIWVVKLNSIAGVIWSKCLGGTGIEQGFSVDTTADGGYIIAGSTTTSGVNGDVTGNRGSADCWVVKLDPDGFIQWQKALGGASEEYARSIRQTSDGGYVLCGESKTGGTSGDVSGNHGGWDCWVVKIGNTGSLEWQKSLGGTSDDYGNSIQQTSDGGYIVGGETASNNGNVSGNHGKTDAWVLKLDAAGSLTWQVALGGAGYEHARSIQQTADGGYILAAYSDSADGDVTVNKGGDDYWIVKMDNAGVIQWQKSFGGTGFDQANSILQTLDGGYVIAGATNSIGGDIPGSHGGYEYGLMKIDQSGNTVVWTMSLGGTASEYPGSIARTFDDGYIVAGYTSSVDGDVFGNRGQRDYWVLKLSRELGIGEHDNLVSHFNISPNPTSHQANILFSLNRSQLVSVNVYDAAGRLVKTLVNESLAQGIHSLKWDITNTSGSLVDNGVYLISIVSSEGLTSQRVTIIK